MAKMDMSAVMNALRRVEKMCCRMQREELPPAAQWLRDNARMLYTQAQLAKNSARAYKNAAYRQAYAFCRQLLQENERCLNEKILFQAAQQWQEEMPFTVRELRALEDLLRIALLNDLCLLLPAVEKEVLACRTGDQLAAQLGGGEETVLPEEPAALCRALETLTDSGDTLSARRLEAMLREKEESSQRVMQLAQEALARTAQEVSADIKSLKQLQKMDFGRMTERLSAACHALQKESEFRRTDAAGRALYLTAAEHIAKRTGKSEVQVCEKALQLARENDAPGGCGYYLLEKSEELIRALGGKPGYFSAHALGVSIAAQVLGTLLFGVPGVFCLPWWGVIPFAFVGAQLVFLAFQRITMRYLPKRRLPRVQSRELGRAGRCLVAVPTLLTDGRHALRMMRQLSVLYLANKNAPLDFMLLGDFSDAESADTPQDEDIITAMRMGVSALNDAYGPRFFAMQRERTFDEGEGCYIASERKRGSILTLCRILLGEKTSQRMAYSSVPTEMLKDRYRYVITLDSDTFLPAGAAEKMILTMLHPLQQGRYAVLQPRMATLPMHVKTWAQKLLGGMTGADGYDSAANDFYQDAFGRGSFMGKGILEPRAFLDAAAQLPPGQILSHDLIEGELAGAQLINDVTCFDGHPRTAEGFFRRAHRWTRGDWQLLPLMKNAHIDALARFKMIDNLRRSITPLMRVIALIASAQTGAYVPFILALLPLRAVGEWLMLPYDACTRADAILRAIFRTYVRRKKLLEWTTAAQADRDDMHLLRESLWPMLPGALLAFAAAYGLFVPGFVLSALWLAVPLLRPVMNRPWCRKEALSPADQAFLRQVAGDTLRFFREHVSAQTHFLPPDNVQLSPPRGAAMRTSPTNIGMYLLSLCAARKLHLMDSDEMLTRMRQTVETLEKMEKWHGNLYNWYDISTLAPLPPKFVSSVDAGNLAICLMAAAQCARKYMQEADRAVRDVPERLDRLQREMKLNRLYDKKEELFYIGCNADTGEMTEGHYDLMASEALLLSFVSIASGQVNEKHWWRLDRTFTRTQGGKALLSWSGTMFEYLLPALLLPAFPGSLLRTSQHACVKTQMKYAQDGFFGISESGYAQFDENLNYAYRAFGVPELSLSGQCQSGVRAPYAAALALLTHPKEAVKALRAWKARGVYGAYGFFEAEDFISGEIPHIVCSHMAHHQGMILCAVCNALCEEDLTSLVFSLPRMRAHLPLLCETPPKRVLKLPKPLREHRDVKESAPLQLRPEEKWPPDTHVLSGGGTVYMQSGRGNGYIAQGDILLTRFDPLPSAVCGPQFYLRAVKEEKACRLTSGEYLFRAGDWRVRNMLGDVRCGVSGCVDPLTGAVIYQVTARNVGDKALRTELTMYLEPALEEMKKNLDHRAFSDLFLSVEETGAGAAQIRRRLREGGERTLRVCALTAGSGAALMMNDRTLFIGRTGSLEQPRGLTLPDAEFYMTRNVEPCIAMRIPWVLPAGREEKMYFALGTGELPQNSEQAARAFSLCASRSQVMQRMLRTDNRQTALLCHLAGYFLRPDTKASEPCCVRDLWAQGVSGDRPFALIELNDLSGEGVLRQILKLLALLFEHGAPGECILLLPAEHDYERPLHTLCENSLMRPALRALRGRVHVKDDTDEGFVRAARALCCIRIDCAEELRPQLAGRELPAPMPWMTEENALPKIPRLRSFNGFGGFTQEGGYTVLPASNGGTTAPWSYMVCSEHFGTLLCEQGILYSHAGNARLRRITAQHQDGVQIVPAEEYFVEENGALVSFTKAGAPGEHYRVTYETGTALYEHAARGLQLSLQCAADEKERAGVRILSIKNSLDTLRTLRIYAAARFAMGEDGRGTAVEASGDQLIVRGGGMPFCALYCMPGAQAYTVSESAYAQRRFTRALQTQETGNIGVLQGEIRLLPGETKEVTVLLGCGGEMDLPRLKLISLHGKSVVRKSRGAWDERLGRMQFFLPDEELSQYLNAFLPYQIRASRLEMRAGFYQSGGAYGFRDQLQDMLPLIYTEPERVRAHLLRCASRQYIEGDVQHWWHPGGAGVRTRISDDLLFLPYVTARYVYVTGDEEILRCRVPYLRSEPLRKEEHDRYETPEETKETGTLTEHCLRAIDHVRLGERGIPLMGGGDWNDGMDRVKGESTWLGFFYLMVLRDFAPLCDKNTQKELSARAQKLQQDLRCAFRNKWFIRAWYEDGRSIGAWDSEVGRIDLISQCFAAFAGMPRNQVLTALDQAWEILHDEKRGVTHLMNPPFAPEENAGYIGAYLPGVRENGGQYTHAVPWFMRALMMYGRKDRAWQLLEEILPYNHSFDVPSARHYRTEPYALPADVYRWGRGGWTWYTGSAAWLYDVFLRDFLGFDKKGDTVTLRPQLPESWEECTVLYHFGQSRYQLTASREMHGVTLDGKRVTGAYITLVDDGRVHEARFPVGEG